MGIKGQRCLVKKRDESGLFSQHNVPIGTLSAFQALLIFANICKYLAFTMKNG